MINFVSNYMIPRIDADGTMLGVLSVDQCFVLYQLFHQEKQAHGSCQYYHWFPMFKVAGENIFNYGINTQPQILIFKVNNNIQMRTSASKVVQ